MAAFICNASSMLVQSLLLFTTFRLCMFLEQALQYSINIPRARLIMFLRDPSPSVGQLMPICAPPISERVARGPVQRGQKLSPVELMAFANMRDYVRVNGGGARDGAARSGRGGVSVGLD